LVGHGVLGWHQGALEERCAHGHDLGDVDLRIQGKRNGLEVGEVHLEHVLFGQQFLELLRLLIAITRLLGHQFHQLDQLVDEAPLLPEVVEDASQVEVACADERIRELGN